MATWRNRFRNRRRSEQGVTLLEVVCALALVTILVIALAEGLLTSTKTDNSVADTQRMNAALTSLSEALKDLRYEHCGDAAWYQALYEEALASVPDAAERRRRFGVASVSEPRILGVRYWKGSSYPVNDQLSPVAPRDIGGFVASCDADEGTQLLTVSVRVGKRTREAQVVKRDPAGIPYDDFVAPSTTAPGGGGGLRPTAAFTIDDNGDGTWTFTSTSTYQEPATIVGWKWDFGYGVFEEGEGPVTRALSPGLYNVKLRVEDVNGASSVASKPLLIEGTPAPVTGLKLARVRHGGGTVAIYDFTWNRVPGVQRYRLTLEWCLGSTGWCPFGEETYDFGESSGGSITKSFPSVPYFYASIKGQVGSAWGPPSQRICGWAPDPGVFC